MSTSTPLLAGLAGLAAVSGAPAQAETPVWRLHDDHVLGTSLDVTIVARSQAAAMMAAGAARAEIDRLDSILSGWRDDSELSALNASTERVVSPELFAVIRAAEGWRETTDGAFDGRMGATTAALRAGQGGEGRLIKASAVTLDPATRTVRRPDGVTFDLDGVAKGYVIDQALTAARAASPDVEGMMVDIGGDLRCWGRAPGGEGWRIGVAGACETADNAAPAAVLQLPVGAVAFSGRGARDLTLDGETHSHIVDPRNGRPVTGTVAACVVAPGAAQADALSTAFSAMTPEAAVAFADAAPGVETLIQTADGRRLASAGWQSLVDTRSGPRAELIRVADGPAWPKGFEVAVGYEIPKFAVGNYRSPYVVVWVTDENKALVRVITMLGDDAKYTPDNYVFWRRYGRKAPGLDAVAKPTRAPGKYGLVWDGKDQVGKPVAQGRYTIHVEAVREHGGHSYTSSDLDLRAAPTTASIAGKDELGAISLRYGKKK